MLTKKEDCPPLVFGFWDDDNRLLKNCSPEISDVSIILNPIEPKMSDGALMSL